eukprot:2429943-Amphidinium_carterae.1
MMRRRNRAGSPNPGTSTRPAPPQSAQPACSRSRPTPKQPDPPRLATVSLYPQVLSHCPTCGLPKLRGHLPLQSQMRRRHLSLTPLNHKLQLLQMLHDTYRGRDRRPYHPGWAALGLDSNVIYDVADVDVRMAPQTVLDHLPH